MSRRDKGLLAEIEDGALSESTSLTKVLQKCIVLGGKARNAELRDWARQELSGYDEGLPEYRVVSAPLKVDRATTSAIIRGQEISPMVLPDFARDQFTQGVSISHGIGNIEALVRNANRSGDSVVKMGHPRGADLVSYMNHERQGQGETIVSLYWEVHVAHLEGLLSHVRTTLISLVAEMRTNMGDDDDLPTPDTASNAVKVVLEGGKRHQITVNANNVKDQGSVSIEQPAQTESGWTRTATIWTVIGALVAIVGIVLAYLQLRA